MGKRMVKRLGTLGFSLLALIAFSCGGDKQETVRKLNIEDKILAGKYSLSVFEADRARDIFIQANEDYKKFYKRNSCEASYGVVLADAQVVVKLLNGLVIRPLLTGVLAPAPYSPQALPVPGRYQTAEAKAYDFGRIGENLWVSFEPYMDELAVYASAVTALPNCTFTIGVGDEPVNDIAVKDNPYKWVLNFGDTQKPIAQLVFRGRLDGAEARVIEGLTRSLMGMADYLLAHDLSLTLDVGKLGLMLGVPVDCIRNDALKCIGQIADGTVPTEPVNWLDIAFLFEDNPKLLTKNLKDPTIIESDRWARRFKEVDNQWARGFFTLRSFFPALLARSAALSTNLVNEKTFNEYLIFFRDRNEDGKVDSSDDFGINLTENGSGIKLSCEFIIDTQGLTADKAQECRTTMSNVEDAINGLALSLLKELFTPSEEAIGEIETFVERVYGNMAAVDNPSITAERIPINSFDNVLRDFFAGALIDSPTPKFMEFDVKAFFNDAKALRDFLPYWERTTESRTLARFIADSDTYNVYPPNSTTPIQLTAPQVLFDQQYAKYRTEWKEVTERAVLQGPYDEGRITNLAQPADCLNPTNLFATLAIPAGDQQDQEIPGAVMYFPLQDPTLNSMIYINMDEWSLLYDNNGNGASSYPPFSCTDPSGFQLPDNQMMTKAMWLYVDFLADHISLTQFLGPILGGLQ